MLLSLVAPYTAEEMWERLGHEPSVARAGWPQADPALLVEESVTCVVQVQRQGARPARGRARHQRGRPARQRRWPRRASCARWSGQSIRKVIVRAPKLVNIVAG